VSLQGKLHEELIKPFWQQLQSAQSKGSSKQQDLLQPLQVHMRIRPNKVLCCRQVGVCSFQPMLLLDTCLVSVGQYVI
jgi:hypothetical protein